MFQNPHFGTTAPPPHSTLPPFSFSEIVTPPPPCSPEQKKTQDLRYRCPLIESPPTPFAAWRTLFLSPDRPEAWPALAASGQQSLRYQDLFFACRLPHAHSLPLAPVQALLHPPRPVR